VMAAPRLVRVLSRFRSTGTEKEADHGEVQW
jgi:hypothetical protein